MLRKLGPVLVLCVAGMPSCAVTPEAHDPGGPFYFERFSHPFPSFYPTLPSRELSRSEASSHRFFVVAWFNERGQIQRMLKCEDTQPSFDLRYRYAADGTYQGEEFAPLPSSET